MSVETFAEFVDAMKAGDVYVNVHTVEHPPGGIRGQVVGTETFVSSLDGEQEDPPVMTDASVNGQVVLSADRTTLRFALSVFDLAPDQITQAHIHVGEPGVNGPVVFFLSATSFTSPLIGTLTAANFIPAPEVGVVTFEDLLDVLFAGDTYINVHTIMYPGGEVRGQLEAPVTFDAFLDSEQEDPPVMTDATGIGQVVSVRIERRCVLPSAFSTCRLIRSLRRIFMSPRPGSTARSSSFSQTCRSPARSSAL